MFRDTKKTLNKAHFSILRYHDAILWGFEAKVVFGAKQVSKILIPEFTLSVGQKYAIDLESPKSSLC